VKVAYADGSSERVHFFASRLKYSRWTHVVVVPNEKVEPLIRALLMAFESFGGVPLRCVFDNPKTIVINRTLHDLLLCYGPGPTLGAIERVIEDDRLHAQAIAWVLQKEAV